MSKETYYKIVRPDGTDLYSGRILWDQVGEIVRHPNPGDFDGTDAKGYFSVSVSLVDCTGMHWPCRLFVVEPVEGAPMWKPNPYLPSKRASHAWRVVRELPAHKALGPNGAAVAAFLDLLPTLTHKHWDAVRDATGGAAWTIAGDAVRFAAWGAAEDAVRFAAWEATWDAVRFAVRDASKDVVWSAAGGAAGALVVRDLISAANFDVLTAPMRAAGIDFNALAAAGTKSDGPAETEDNDKKET